MVPYTTLLALRFPRNHRSGNLVHQGSGWHGLQSMGKAVLGFDVFALEYKSELAVDEFHVM